MPHKRNSPHLPTSAELDRVRDDSQWHGVANAHDKRARTARELRARIWEGMKELVNNASGPEGTLLASEARQYDQLEAAFDELERIADENTIDRRGVVARDRDDAGPYREGEPLAKGQTFAGYVRAQGMVPEVEELGEEPFSLAKYVRGAFTGDWSDAERERILNVQTGATPAGGGVLIPTILTADLIDLARNQLRVLQAGARVVPMENRQVDVPRWTKDPQPGFRAEGAAIAEDDATLDKVTLSAKTLAVVTKATREVVEDTGIVGDLENAFAKAFALKIDSQALYGDGSSNSLTGVKNTAGVTKTPLAANGAAPTNWDFLVDSAGRVRDANFDPNAQIMHDRTARELAKLKATGSGEYLAPPAYLEGIDRYSTSQVPINLVVGTSAATTSDVVTGQFDQLLLGVRMQLVITPLNERFMVDAGQYGFVAWWRGDVQLAHTAAFDFVTGIL